MGKLRRDRPRSRAAAPPSLTVALLALACSVYEAPTVPGDGGSGTGDGGRGGTGLSTAGGDSEGGVAVSGGNAGASSGGGVGAGASPGAGMAGSAVGEPSGGEGGAPSMIDECPDDPDKVAPGDCGCGVPDAPSATNADCKTLKSLLAHRYDFEGTGTEVKDRVGAAHGSIARGATLSKLDGKGVVLLGGGAAGTYVDLPNHLLSALTNATVEAWVTWGGGDRWQRIFDFGDSTNASPENNPENGKSYLFLTPRSGNDVAFAAYSLAGNATDKETGVSGTAPLAQSLSHVAVVADDAADKLALYVNGALVAEQSWTGSLAAINDVNVWLGRSQFGGDPELSAVFHEFRIYNAALSEAQLAASFNGGPDPAYLAY